jgi:peptidoglycan hydrolase-like amidase
MRHALAQLFAIGTCGALVALAAVQILAPGDQAAPAATIADDPSQRVVLHSRSNLFNTDTALATVGLEPAAERAAYVGYPDAARPGEDRIIAVAVRNEGNVKWETTGDHPVKLSYHLYDATGALISWDGFRSALPYDLPPGGAEVVPMRIGVPSLTGIYTVKPDLIRDGKSWFSAQGAAPGQFKLRVTSDLDAGYVATAPPATIVPGGETEIDVTVKNTGLKVWRAGGDHPIRLGYHWFDMSSNAVMWDGPRALLPRDIAPGDEIRVRAFVRAPSSEGTYALSWDMVQEGVGWFSRSAVPMKQDIVSVQPGVTLYGKGWGHGIGLSQWGAQGWAEGAAGPRLSGEQIVAKYFPGAKLSMQPPSSPFRVLLSDPSTGCVNRTIYNTARMHSEGGMRLVNNADPSVVYADFGPNHPIVFGVYRGSVLVASDGWSGRNLFVGETDTIALVPTQWWDPITIDQKGLSYRGNIAVSLREGGMLRVVNYVSSDDYMMGTLPGEMPGDWEMEALRAQAITARTYAAWRQSTAGDRTWDVRDDVADQCYGGHSFESPRTTAAVKSTPATILTYDGKPIRALFSSAHGGISENVGCLLEAELVGTTWTCAQGWPYLQVIDDPAERNAWDVRGRNPHDDLWARYFSADVIRHEIIVDYGVDIGQFVSMEFTMSPGGRPVSVRVRGTDRVVNLKGDRFLRTTIGLRSSLVRTVPF